MEMENKIREDFMKGYDCSQVVCSKFADKLGIDRNTAEKMSAAFGGGMQQGNMGMNQNMNGNAQQMGGTWKCQCGADNTGKFCEFCGQPRPF